MHNVYSKSNPPPPPFLRNSKKLFYKGVVTYYQAALSKEFTPLDITCVKPGLFLSRGGPGQTKMVSEVQIQKRYDKVAPKSGIIFCVKLTVKN